MKAAPYLKPNRKKPSAIRTTRAYPAKELEGFKTNIYPHLKKIIFVGCGASTAHAIAGMPFTRKNAYEIVVYEPEESRPFFFPGNFMDLFSSDSTFRVNQVKNLSDAILPGDYQDTIWEKSSIVEIDPDERFVYDDAGFEVNFLLFFYFFL